MVADRHGNSRTEVVLIRWRDYYVLAESVDEDSDHMVLRLQRDTGLLAAEHPEQLVGVTRDIERFELLLPLPLLIQYLNIQHLVHTVVDHDIVFCIIGDEIILLVVPHQSPRAQRVPPAVIAELHLLFEVPLEVLKADLLVGTNGLVDLVDIVVDALVHRLDAARHDDLSVELAGVIPADQRLELADQLARLPVRNKFCRLDRVHQQLELRQLEVPAAEVIVVVAALLLPDYVEAEFSQLVKILVQRLAVRIDPVTAEHRDYLRHRKRVIVVSLL